MEQHQLSVLLGEHPREKRHGVHRQFPAELPRRSHRRAGQRHGRSAAEGRCGLVALQSASECGGRSDGRPPSAAVGVLVDRAHVRLA